MPSNSPAPGAVSVIPNQTLGAHYKLRGDTSTHIVVGSCSDAYLSTEIYEHQVQLARATKLPISVAGHRAIQKSGARALANHLAARIGLEHGFFDIPIPA